MQLISFVLPALITFINKKVSNTDNRFWVSVIVCSVFGIFLNYVSTQFHFDNPQMAFNSVTESIMVTFGIAQISYNTVFKEESVLKNAIEKVQ